MKNKKLLGFLLGIGIILLIIGIFGHSFLNKAAKNYLKSELEVLNAKNEYIYQAGSLDIRLLGGSIVLKDFKIKPSDAYLEAFNNGEAPEPTLKELSVDQVSFKGIGIIDLLLNNHLNIRNIQINKPTFKILKHPENYKTDSVPGTSKSNFYLDSIQIRKTKEISLSEFNIVDYELQILDVVSKDTILQYTGKDMTIDGIDLEPSEKNPNYFYFNTEKLLFKLQKQTIDLNADFYSVNLDNLVYDHSKQSIEIDGFAFSPMVENTQIMSASKYTSEVYKLEMQKMNINGFNLNPLIHSGILIIDQIIIEQLTAEITKDKSKPFNTKKVKNLPQESLQNLNFPMLIQSIDIKNSTLNYSEQDKAPKDLLDLNLTDLNINISNVTSLKDTTLKNKALEISINTLLSGELPIETKINMPYNSYNNAFTFTGHSNKGVNFNKFNSVVFKALNIKIEGGVLNGIKWSAQGNDEKLEGEFTMLYKELEVDLYKEDQSQAKTLSWLANAVVPKSNPGNNGKVFIASMKFERVKYKGLGNFLWKGIQSGLINSINPLAKPSPTSSSNSQKAKSKKQKERKEKVKN
ncbi:hypothetical protein [Eudoraea chungangensis]|uniref:hypothetical protein n=1 Tax=Eudoraea chungangensis TaxID=1481905 RepID=UPI0023EC42EB|nr:hypothetical protein [Eudoraea chungangensis]